MRVEPTPHVFRNEDRRGRFRDRRGAGEERRTDPGRSGERAQHAPRLWITAVFGAHLLGQQSRQGVSPEEAERAYGQPESRTPLRPRHETAA